MILNFERKNTDLKILWDHKNSISYTNNEKMKNEVIPTASQPAILSFWRERCCPVLPVGTGWAYRVRSGLCWHSCQEHCPEVSEWLRDLWSPVASSVRCSQTLPEQGH